MIKIRCACGKKLAVPDGAAGKSARCPACGALSRVPKAPPPPPAPVPRQAPPPMAPPPARRPASSAAMPASVEEIPDDPGVPGRQTRWAWPVAAIGVLVLAGSVWWMKRDREPSAPASPPVSPAPGAGVSSTSPGTPGASAAARTPVRTPPPPVSSAPTPARPTAPAPSAAPPPGPPTPAQELAKRREALAPNDARGRLELAAWCRRQPFPQDADRLFREALWIDLTAAAEFARTEGTLSTPELRLAAAEAAVASGRLDLFAALAGVELQRSGRDSRARWERLLEGTPYRLAAGGGLDGGISTEERVLGAVPEDVRLIDGWVSPDGRYSVYAGRKDDKFFVVVDGKKGPEFDAVEQVLISPDSQVVSYAARRGDRWLMVVGGKNGEELEGVKNPSFGPGGHFLVYIGRKDGVEFVVAGNKRLPSHEQIGWVSASRNGDAVAYTLYERGTRSVTIGDRKGEEFDEVSRPIVSADGSRTVYAARKGARCWLVVGNGKFEIDEYVWPLPAEDGALCASVAWNGKISLSSSGLDPRTDSVGSDGGKVRMKVGGRTGREYESVGLPVPAPGGREAVYPASRGGIWFLVREDREGEPATSVKLPTFSPDGKLAYAAGAGNKECVCLGDWQSERFSEVVRLGFTPDGRKLGMGVRQGKEYSWKVVDVASKYLDLDERMSKLKAEDTSAEAGKKAWLGLGTACRENSRWRKLAEVIAISLKLHPDWRSDWTAFLEDTGFRLLPGDGGLESHRVEVLGVDEPSSVSTGWQRTSSPKAGYRMFVVKVKIHASLVYSGPCEMNFDSKEPKKPGHKYEFSLGDGALLDNGGNLLTTADLVKADFGDFSDSGFWQMMYEQKEWSEVSYCFVLKDGQKPSGFRFQMEPPLPLP
ncbi:MAG: hypothetical protein HYY93_01965 [Planctomycetes bacterium]|nr:hypothetical protein [Planctomycetota bacterium]